MSAILYYHLCRTPHSLLLDILAREIIDLANLDDLRQLFNHIIDKMSELEQNLEKETKSNLILNKSLKNLESKYHETQRKLKNLNGEFCDFENEL